MLLVFLPIILRREACLIGISHLLLVVESHCCLCELIESQHVEIQDPLRIASETDQEHEAVLNGYPSVCWSSGLSLGAALPSSSSAFA